MPKHIEPFDNKNIPIVDVNDHILPLCYFNVIRLKKGEHYSYCLDHYESVIVPAYGTCDLKVESELFPSIGKRRNLWQGKPEGCYIPMGSKAIIHCVSDVMEVFIAGGKTEKKYAPFCIRDTEVDTIRYGSDETKTHREIKHILGKNGEGRSGRLLVSELFTVGKGGWSGFPPHKHDVDRPPIETRFEELYQFRFNPEKGFGAQFLYAENGDIGPVCHIKNGSTILIDKGYHPCVVAPGYQMYYFTMIVGEAQRSLIQFFQPDHEDQVETIPGIKDMIAGFK